MHPESSLTDLYDPQLLSKKQAVSAGHSHTVGLRKDGRVVAVGDDEYG